MYILVSLYHFISTSENALLPPKNVKVLAFLLQFYIFDSGTLPLNNRWLGRKSNGAVRNALLRIALVSGLY